MSIKIQTRNRHKEYHFQVLFDPYGNVYLDGSSYGTDPYFVVSDLPLIYQINVDRHNKPFMEPGNYPVANDVVKPVHKLIPLGDGSLKKHTKKEKEHVMEEHEMEVEENYYPEKMEFMEDVVSEESEEFIDEDLLNKYGEHNVKFRFSGIQLENTMIVPREDENISALYDTYIYDKGVILFKSESQNEESIYLMKIHTDGKLIFRPIGYRDVAFNCFLHPDGTMEVFSSD